MSESGADVISERFVIEDFWDAVGEIRGKGEGLNENLTNNSKF